MSGGAASRRGLTPIASGPAAESPGANLRVASPPNRDGRDPAIEAGRAVEWRPLTRRLAQAMAEVLAGARSPSQLSGLVSLDVLRLLHRQYGRLNAPLGVAPTRPIVRSVHLSEPRPGVVEACAVIAVGHRVRAIALRLENGNDQWRCTALRIA
jgi:Family of unknown function (DUF6459)